jgi:homoserine kinase
LLYDVRSAKSDAGFDIEIYKNIKAGSGIGVRHAGAVYGINVLLGNPFAIKDLCSLRCNEKLVCGNAHADVAPALGWIYVMRSYSP